jgi:uncharacterized protein (TIRG00374 family)
MKLRRGLASLAIITLVYLLALGWADTERRVFHLMPVLLGLLPALMLLSLLSYGLRYARWHYLLRRCGHRLDPRQGFPAYLAGFAFTATPGKAGELLRIRYFQPLGIAADLTIATFVFERALDLIVILALASMAAAHFGLFPLLAAFVLVFLGLLVVAARHTKTVFRISAWLHHHQWPATAGLLRVLGQGLSQAGRWLTARDLLVSCALGAAAWLLTSMAFMALLQALDIPVARSMALAIYPMAMLAGAASMIPGGLGSTEAAIITMLHALGVELPTATLAAVGIRLASLWFAIIIGLLCIMLLEHRSAALPSPPTQT